MEKNQHNDNASTKGGQHKNDFTGNQPGQQLPTGTPAENTESSLHTPEEKTRHSESSFPQQEGETLGTP